MKKWKVFLFDLDDTLIDHKSSQKIGLERCYERFFRSCASLAAFLADYEKINHSLWERVETGEIASGHVSSERFRQLTERYAIPFSQEIPQFYEEELIAHCRWLEGAKEALDHLKVKEHKIGFVTNGFSHVQRSKYDKLALSTYSDVLVISDEIGISKPHPDIFHRTLQLLEADPLEAIMVGDSLSSDGEGARNAGISFCWYNATQAADPADWQPDWVIRHLSELIS